MALLDGIVSELPTNHGAMILRSALRAWILYNRPTKFERSQVWHMVRCVLVSSIGLSYMRGVRAFQQPHFKLGIFGDWRQDVDAKDDVLQELMQLPDGSMDESFTKPLLRLMLGNDSEFGVASSEYWEMFFRLVRLLNDLSTQDVERLHASLRSAACRGNSDSMTFHTIAARGISSHIA